MTSGLHPKPPQLLHPHVYMDWRGYGHLPRPIFFSSNPKVLQDLPKPVGHSLSPQLLTELAALKVQGVRSLTYPNLLWKCDVGVPVDLSILTASAETSPYSSTVKLSSSGLTSARYFCSGGFSK